MIWPVLGPRRRVLQALAVDDGPLRTMYERERHTSIAMLRDRLAEPGDHERLAWPDYDSYRDYVLSNLRRDRRKRLVWPEQQGWRFPMLAGFTVTLATDTVAFWPDECPNTPSGKGPPYIIRA